MVLGALIVGVGGTAVADRKALVAAMQARSAEGSLAFTFAVPPAPTS
eukprot:COSAG05_NODE_690_length_7901_cov_174.242886_2_plen_47_part_00